MLLYESSANRPSTAVEFNRSSYFRHGHHDDAAKISVLGGKLASKTKGHLWHYTRPHEGRIKGVAVWAGDVALDLGTQFHEEAQFVYVLRGCRLFLIGGELVTVTAGQLAYTPPTIPHRSLAVHSEGACCLNVYVEMPISDLWSQIRPAFAEADIAVCEFGKRAKQSKLSAYKGSLSDALERLLQAGFTDTDVTSRASVPMRNKALDIHASFHTLGCTATSSVLPWHSAQHREKAAAGRLPIAQAAAEVGFVT